MVANHLLTIIRWTSCIRLSTPLITACHTWTSIRPCLRATVHPKRPQRHPRTHMSAEESIHMSNCPGWRTTRCRPVSNSYLHRLRSFMRKPRKHCWADWVTGSIKKMLIQLTILSKISIIIPNSVHLSRTCILSRMCWPILTRIPLQTLALKTTLVQRQTECHKQLSIKTSNWRASVRNWPGGSMTKSIHSSIPLQSIMQALTLSALPVRKSIYLCICRRHCLNSSKCSIYQQFLHCSKK